MPVCGVRVSDGPGVFLGSADCCVRHCSSAAAVCSSFKAGLGGFVFHAPLVIHPSEGSCRACNTRHMVCVAGTRHVVCVAGTTSATQVHSQVNSRAALFLFKVVRGLVRTLSRTCSE